MRRGEFCGPFLLQGGSGQSWCRVSRVSHAIGQVSRLLQGKSDQISYRVDRARRAAG